MIVHRLDEATSGVLVLARTVEAQRSLHEQFRRHTTRKRYTALVEGRLGLSSGGAASGATTTPTTTTPTTTTMTTTTTTTPESAKCGGFAAVQTCEGEVDLPLGRHPTRQPWQVVDLSKRGKPSLTQWRLLLQNRDGEEDERGVSSLLNRHRRAQV